MKGILQRAGAVCMAIVLASVFAAPAYTEEETEQTNEEILQEMDTDAFGEGHTVVRNPDKMDEIISVDGYPVQHVVAGLEIPSSEEEFIFELSFAEYPFWQPATEYDGNLALMSFAMAMSANRVRNLAGEPDSDFDPARNLEDFFRDAGFEDIRKDDYSKETSMYTVSTAMGFKKMEHEGEEPYTLIAVGVCGANYDNEWQSNMTPGTGEMHEGFRSAAELVIDRISGYIMTRGIRGRIKLWISGFSRAAAVSNLTAGLLVRDGVFPKEDVFAYTFATPAAVFQPPAEGYENIFNIISPMDLIPQVMPVDWDFGRFGRDLYLPLPEFSSFGRLMVEVRAEILRLMLGMETNYSPAMNLRLRLLYSLMLDLLKNREEYNTWYQPALVGIMQDMQVSNLLTTIRNLFLSVKDRDRETQNCLDRFVDYTLRLLSNTLTRTELAEANLNDASAVLRLFNEHRPDVYLACTEQIHQEAFLEEKDFTYVLVRGPVDLTLTDPDYPEYLVRLTEQGKTVLSPELREELEPADTILNGGSNQPFYLERHGNVSIVAVPHDARYAVEWTAARGGTVEIRQVNCSVRAFARYTGASSGVLRVSAGDRGIAYSADREHAPAAGTMTESVFDAMDLASFIGITSVGVNWRVSLMTGIMLAGVILFLVIRILTALLLKKRKIGAGVWICLCIFCISVLETEVSYWIFADRPALRIIWKAITGLALTATVLLRCRRSGIKPRNTLLPAVLTAVLADILLSFSFAAGGIAYLLYTGILCILFLRRAPMRRGRWIRWAAVSLFAAVLIVLAFGPQQGLNAWAAACFAPVLLLMNYSAGRHGTRIRAGAGMFLASDALLGLYGAVLAEPAVHAAGILLFYGSLLLFSAADFRKDRADQESR